MSLVTMQMVPREDDYYSACHPIGVYDAILALLESIYFKSPDFDQMDTLFVAKNGENRSLQ